MKRIKLIEFRGDKTQKEMGIQYGVTQQIWSRWENGIRTPSIKKMKQLENDIGIPMEDIFCDVFSPIKNDIQKERQGGDEDFDC